MEVDIEQGGKAVASIIAAVAKILPIVRDWRAKKQSEPEELKAVSESVDQIQDGLAWQQRIAYVFRPLIENYGQASELLSLVDKVIEFCQENESVLNETSETGKNLRKALKNMVDHIANYDIILLKRIKDDSVHFLREKDKQILKRAAEAISAELAAVEVATQKDTWNLEILRGHLRAMKRDALDLKTEFLANFCLLVDTLAFAKF